jgi:hypothetical protein
MMAAKKRTGSLADGAFALESALWPDVTDASTNYSAAAHLRPSFVALVH